MREKRLKKAEDIKEGIMEIIEEEKYIMSLYDYYYDDDDEHYLWAEISEPLIIEPLESF